MNIHQAINEVMKEVGYVQKERAQNLNYSFTGEAALIAALRPAMVRTGILVYVEEVKDVVTREYTTAKGTLMTNVSLTATISFVSTDGSMITVQARGEGSDSGDKANNKAMTCAYKYALRQTFMIETGNDPDREQQEEKKLTIETARAMKTPKGTPLGNLNQVQLQEVKEKSAHLAPAADLILKTDFNLTENPQ